MQCFVGDEARRRRAIEERVLAVFEGWDYEEIIPPLFDYADVFAGGALAARTYSFVGRDGSLLALRPDFTSLLAKIAAGRLADRPAPIRLYYSGEVLRYEPPRAGRQSELYQMGLEHLGGEARAADAEVLAIAAECLAALGVQGCVLALGHVGVFGGLVEAAGSRAAGLAGPARAGGEQGRGGGARGAARGGGRRRPWPSLVRLTTLAGGPRSWTRPSASAVAFGGRRGGRSRTARPSSPRSTRPGLGEHVAIDLGEVRGLDYYTGLVFRASRRASASRWAAAAATTACSRASGGRCPRWASCSASIAWRCCWSGRAPSRSGRPSRCRSRERRGPGASRPRAPARRGRPRALLRRRGRGDEPHRRALEGQAARRARRRCSAAPGLPFPEDEGRRLVVALDGLRFLFVKDMDVPTYVEYGVADCGIAGRDVLLEAGSDVYEPLDLGFGRCRLVVARPPGARGDYRRPPPCAWRPSTRGWPPATSSSAASRWRW